MLSRPSAPRAKKAAENAVLKDRGVKGIKQTSAESAEMSEASYIVTKSIYDNAVTPAGYKSTSSGKTPKWAKMLAVLDDNSISTEDKLKFVNAEADRKTPFKTVSEARKYYEDDKKKDKK